MSELDPSRYLRFFGGREDWIRDWLRRVGCHGKRLRKNRKNSYFSFAWSHDTSRASINLVSKLLSPKKSLIATGYETAECLHCGSCPHCRAYGTTAIQLCLPLPSFPPPPSDPIPNMTINVVLPYKHSLIFFPRFIFFFFFFQEKRQQYSSVPQCQFSETLTDTGYYEYRSVQYPQWFVGFSRRGRPRNGRKSCKKCRHFLSYNVL